MVGHNSASSLSSSRFGPASAHLLPPHAPYLPPPQVAPPLSVFLNNQYCLPLVRPETTDAGTGNAAAAVDPGAGLLAPTAGIGRRRLRALLMGGLWPAAAAAAPALPGAGAAGFASAGRQLQQAPSVPPVVVEYMPLQYKDLKQGLFVSSFTQFYFR